MKGDDFRDYYEKELQYLHEAGERFAERHPQLADQLKISRRSFDPDMERLRESFAFLSAKVNQRIDYLKGHLVLKLMEDLYPNYAAGLPSMSIIQLVPDRQLARRADIARGRVLETVVAGNFTCKVTTARDVALWPIELLTVSAQDCSVHDKAPAGSHGVLTLIFGVVNPDVKLEGLGLDELILHFTGNDLIAFSLYEWLTKDSLMIEYSTARGWQRLGRENLQDCTFDNGSLAIPQDHKLPGAWQMLREFYAMPHKHLFLRLANIKDFDRTEGTLAIRIYTASSPDETVQATDAKNVVIGATPIINLYEHLLEPQLIDGKRTIHLVTHSQDQAKIEAYRVLSLGLRDAAGVQRHLFPNLSPSRLDPEHAETFTYQIERTLPLGEATQEEECYAILSQDAPDQGLLEGRVLATNRRLLQNAGTTRFHLLEKSAHVRQIVGLLPVTEYFAPTRGEAMEWALLSMIGSQQFLRRDPSRYLQKIMHLMDVVKSPKSKKYSALISGLTFEKATKRVYIDGEPTLVRGAVWRLELSQEPISKGLDWILIHILERIICECVPINCFIQFSVFKKGQEQPVKIFPLRIGDQIFG